MSFLPSSHILSTMCIQDLRSTDSNSTFNSLKSFPFNPPFPLHLLLPLLLKDAEPGFPASGLTRNTTQGDDFGHVWMASDGATGEVSVPGREESYPRGDKPSKMTCFGCFFALA